MPQGMGAQGLNSLGQVDDGSFSKAATAAAQALAEMYKHAYKQDPGGELCQGIHEVLNAVGDIEAQYEGAGATAADMQAQPDQAVPMEGDAESAMEDQGEPVEEPTDPAAMAQMDSQAAGPPPTSMNDAGAQLETMLQAANQRRRNG